MSSNISSATKSTLEVIRAEKSLPGSLTRSEDPKQTEDPQVELLKCTCKTYNEDSDVRISPTQVEEILREKEIELRAEYERILEREKQQIKERYNFILLNEQTRASHMLREAHRERQEKIRALQSQLQCKNLAALMYVMCTERKRNRFEKLQIIEDYTNYINVLHDILTKGQELILHLSRGYKTAARVDHEWREKMTQVVSQFLAFIYNFAGGDPETNQYLIDLPKLLKTDAPLEVDPNEDPCDSDEDKGEEVSKDASSAARSGKEWWEELEAEHAPFVMFGDMADFAPGQRRDVCKTLKAQKIQAKKTAPKEWKELAFKEMFLKSKCVHLNKIKTMYQDKLPTPIKWECHSPFEKNGDVRGTSKISMAATHRGTSVDIRGTMGSILKIIALGPSNGPVPAKTELLGARDSMEIASMTKLRMSIKPDTTEHHSVVLNIGKHRPSMFADYEKEEASTVELHAAVSIPKDSASTGLNQNLEGMSPLALGSVHTDSLQMVHSHHPEIDHMINYERACPMEKCKHLQVDSFMRSLPPYMRANPFTHFEQTFEEYETCTPEQLQMLQQRIENRMNKESQKDLEPESGTDSELSEWSSTGVAVQTSDTDMLPPCTCQRTHESPGSPVSRGKSPVLDLKNLELVKVAMHAIHKECLFSDKIEFNRFKLIGKDLDWKEKIRQEKLDANFKGNRYQEITKILNKHPSLLEIFQANTK